MVILKNSTRESAKIGQAIDTQFQTGGDPWLAVDIGTTTVVVDLYTSYGELVATLAEDNAQGYLFCPCIYCTSKKKSS